ncbi:MAG: exo-alpha-sialidase [Opitutaceae bacterium]|nr:exo-alpha-sialidase [Opitutaceae bacterium]
MRSLSFFLAIVTVTAAAPQPPVIYTGTTAVTTAADGGLPPAVGVHAVQVYRANRTKPTHVDGLTDTYLHAPMLVWWQGYFYLEYLSGPRDEHQDPCSTSLVRSRDGITWEAPRVIFPAIRLPSGAFTLAHQRMGFYTAPDGRLLVLAFYGVPPSPNDGTGLGRVVREIYRDGSLGPIHVIRPNARQPFPGFSLPYPLYSDSTDAEFIAACRSLLANKLMTAQWWEEDQLDETGFYTVRGKALSFARRPDGSVLGVWKNALVAVTADEGRSWTEKTFATGLPNNASKYWLQRTGDGRYALFFNPTNRNRHPLAVATSADTREFGGLLSVHGELPDQRFGGGYKNMGPQYVRGLVEGNGQAPDAAAASWITYSVNKEDIWVARVPVPISGKVSGPVVDAFDQQPAGGLPSGWNVYSPVWAPVRVVAEGPGGNHVLSLSDEDPYDYARAIRVFPATHGLRASFRVLARQPGTRLEIDLLDEAGARPVRIALGEDGRIWACHEGQWLDAGPYATGRWLRFDLNIPPEADADRCAITVDGKAVLKRPAFFTDPVRTVHRISFRTGLARDRGYGGRDLPGADERSPRAEFLIDDVSLAPVGP